MDLNRENFGRLLKWLEKGQPDPARKYEEIRRKLIMFFSCNQRSDAEDLADCTIDRVSGKVPEIAETYHGDPAPYFLRVARFILLEQSRKPLHVVAAGDFPDPVDPRVRQSSGGDKQECLQGCLETLSLGKRSLLLGYYRELGPAKKAVRRALAGKEGIGLNALRIRVHRIRHGLVDCWSQCMENRRLEAPYRVGPVARG